MNRTVFCVLTRDAAQLSNRIRTNGWELRDLSIEDGQVRFAIASRDAGAAAKWLIGNGYTYRILYRRTYKDGLRSCLRHSGLFAAMVFWLGMCVVAGQFCYYSDVQCPSDPALGAEVAKLLEQQGYDGVFAKRKLDCGALARSLVENNDRIAFAQCYYRGGRLIVDITPDHADLPDPPQYSRIVATHDAIVTRVLPRSGTACVSEGSVVKAGDLLIDGKLIIGDEQDPAHTETVVPADGDVYGRVWYSRTLYIPGTRMQVVRTGNVHVARVLQLGGKSWGKPSCPFSEYQVETTTATWSSILSITMTTYRFYETRVDSVMVTDEWIQAEIARAEIELAASLPSDAVLLDRRNVQKRLDNSTRIDIYYEIEQCISRGE